MNGREWIVEAFGCSAEHLCNLRALQELFHAVITELQLNPVTEPQWHVFPAPGGITGVCILAESHLTVHTFPEYESMCVNLFCCTPRDAWNWEARLLQHVGASRVEVRVLDREYAKHSVPEVRAVCTAEHFHAETRRRRGTARTWDNRRARGDHTYRLKRKMKNRRTISFSSIVFH